jgi:hypothetical protein
MNKIRFRKSVLIRCLAVVACLILLSFIKIPIASTEGADLGWQLAGQIGGTTKALLLEGGTLYVGTGLRVMLLNAADPKAITAIGLSPLLPQFVKSITSDGKGHLFVCCGSGGLVILDVTDPAAPEILSKLDTRGYTEGVAIYQNYAVIADGPHGVQIIDISDLTKPVTVSNAYPLAYAYSIEIKGSVAYVAGGGSGLFTVDISDPESPVEKGLLLLNGFQYDVEFANGRLYTAGAWGGISVLSVEDPLAPKLIATAATSGWAMALEAFGDDLLVLDGADGAMIYSTSSATPVRLSVCTLGGFMAAGALGGKTAFVLDNEKGLVAIDYTQKSKPEIICRWLPLLDARRVTMSSGACYVSGGLSGMHVIDMGDMKNPTETYWYDTEAGYANKVIVDGSTAYLTTHLATREPLVIFDASNPLKPVKLGAVPNDAAIFNSAFRSMCLGGGVMLIAAEQCEITVNIDDLSHPKAEGRLDMENPINADSYGNLMISTNSSELQLVNVSDPANPRLVSKLAKNSSGEAITFIDQNTIITSADPGVWVVDVSDPVHPKKISELAISGSVMDIFIDGTTAYLATLGNGVHIIDLTDPKKPIRLGGISTIGLAYDCYAEGDLLLVADSYAGLIVYQKGVAQSAAGSEGTAKAESTPLAIKTDDIQYALNLATPNQTAPAEAYSYVVTSASDSGPGTLRDCLQHLNANTTVTFDPAMFPAGRPATIQLETPLPEIVRDYLTIDASNAGVILDGSKLTNGNGLTIYSFHNKVMGMQIMNFPNHAIDLQGGENVLGGSRNTGAGPIGQGNLASGNGWYGIRVGGYNQRILGNLVGTDMTGTHAVANFNGVFIAESRNVTVGGVNPGEGNVISGNKSINIDTWGEYTRIIGNIIGLDITGTKAVNTDTSSNLTMESNVMNAVVGGTTPKERNVISGASIGVVFSDPNSYQCSLIGNYIGTDIMGTKAVPNHDGVLLFTSGNHRVGGTLPGEGNLISGNQNGIQLNGYGVSDNIVLGNRIGVDANGEPLPNETAVSINMGQKHTVIGGYTQAEGNLIYGGSISLRITNNGIQDCFFAGNSVTNLTGTCFYLEDHASNNFIQGNTICKTTGNAIRVDYGTGNQLRGNTYANQKISELILLMENGNLGLHAPVVKTANNYTVAGTACANGLVEICVIEGEQIVPLGFTVATEKGKFTYQSDLKLGGKKIVLLVTDVCGNTSAFSKAYTAKNSGKKP